MSGMWEFLKLLFRPPLTDVSGTFQGEVETALWAKRIESFKEHLGEASKAYWSWPWLKDAAEGRSIFLSSLSSHFRISRPVLLHRTTLRKLLLEYHLTTYPDAEIPWVTSGMSDFPFRWMMGLVLWNEGDNSVLKDSKWLEALKDPARLVLPRISKDWKSTHPEIFEEWTAGVIGNRWLTARISEKLGLSCYLDQHVFRQRRREAWGKATWLQQEHQDNLSSRIKEFELQARGQCYLGITDTKFRGPGQVKFPVCHDPTKNNYFELFRIHNYPKSLFNSSDPLRWLVRDYYYEDAWLGVIPEGPKTLIGVYPEDLTAAGEPIIKFQYTPYGALIWPDEQLSLGEWILNHYTVGR